jgi:hypothetical protein
VRLLRNLVHSVHCTVARIQAPNDIDSPAKTRARAMKQTITRPAGEERCRCVGSIATQVVQRKRGEVEEGSAGGEEDNGRRWRRRRAERGRGDEAVQQVQGAAAEVDDRAPPQLRQSSGVPRRVGQYVP